VDDVFGGQVVAARDLRPAGRTAAERAALGEESRAGGAVDGAVDATAAQQRGVGGVHDGVDGERGDVDLDGAEARGGGGHAADYNAAGGVSGSSPALRTPRAELSGENIGNLFAGACVQLAIADPAAIGEERMKRTNRSNVVVVVVFAVLASCGVAVASREPYGVSARVELRRDRDAATAAAAPSTRPAAEAGSLEQKLVGTWFGPDCGGDYTFRADGTFEYVDLTPARNTVRGTWAVRWDALPPTLVITCASAADAMKLDPMRRPDAAAGGGAAANRLECKLVSLTADAMAYVAPGDEWVWHFSRSRDTGGFVTTASAQ
jgi:hypothetical protein